MIERKWHDPNRTPRDVMIATMDAVGFSFECGPDTRNFEVLTQTPEAELDAHTQSQDSPVHAVNIIVGEEAADLLADFRPDSLIGFWSGGVSYPALDLQAHFAGERIFDVTTREGAAEIGVDQLSIQSLHMLRRIYGLEHEHAQAMHYALESAFSKPELLASKQNVVALRLGKKATSRALTIYQYGD